MTEEQPSYIDIYGALQSCITLEVAYQKARRHELARQRAAGWQRSFVFPRRKKWLEMRTMLASAIK